jgi:molybdopterin converting factor subunit 1
MLGYRAKVDAGSVGVKANGWIAWYGSEAWSRWTGARSGGSRYSEPMQVRVLYFGVLRDVAGAAEETVELADGATVGDLLGLLRARTSNGGMDHGTEEGLSERLWRSLAVAVNREYGSASIVLREGDEVALLPPVSGGLCRERVQVRC